MVNLIAYVMIPLILSNVLHMVVVKKNLFPNLNIPISAATFGPNKSWRGIIVVCILNAFFQILINSIMEFQSAKTALFNGAVLGLTYTLFELPNSWIKRRLGIKSGEKSKVNPFLFMLMDKMDSAFGVSLVSTIVFGLSTTQGVLFFIIAVSVHIFFSVLLVAGGIKKSF
jgi:CDP-diacylglycerol--serine O-phosphatidyltransferase